LEFRANTLGLDGCTFLRHLKLRFKLLRSDGVISFRFANPAGEFAVKSSPETIGIVPEFSVQQAEGLLCAQLGDSGEITDAKPIQNLAAGELSCTKAQWALDVVWGGRWAGRNGFLFHSPKIQTTKTNRLWSHGNVTKDFLVISRYS
jgi:hypothetical protein